MDYKVIILLGAYAVTYVLGFGAIYAHLQRRYKAIARAHLYLDFFMSLFFASVPFVMLFTSRYMGLKFLPIHDDDLGQLVMIENDEGLLHCEDGPAVYPKYPPFISNVKTVKYYINGTDITDEVNTVIDNNKFSFVRYFKSYRFSKDELLLFKLKFL